MHTNRSQTVVRLLGTSAALLLLAGSTLAQERPRPNPSDTLRGPSVNDRAMPRQERFGDSMMESSERGQMANYRMLMASVKSLAEQDNQRLKLTEEQTEAITRIQNDYRDQLKEYTASSREEAQNLRKRVQAATKEAGEDREAREQIMKRARARANEIRENAPKSDRFEALVWEQLTPPQRRFVTAEMERMADQTAQQRMEQRRQRGGEGEKPGAERVRPDSRPDARPGADLSQRPGAGERPARPDGPAAIDNARRGDRPASRETDRPEAQQRRWAELFQRIQQLTPEQQDRLFNMINQTVDRAASPRDTDAARRGGEDRPARPAGVRPERGERSPESGRGPRP